jgi:hypothetical protein
LGGALGLIIMTAVGQCDDTSGAGAGKSEKSGFALMTGNYDEFRS